MENQNEAGGTDLRKIFDYGGYRVLFGFRIPFCNYNLGVSLGKEIRGYYYWKLNGKRILEKDIPSYLFREYCETHDLDPQGETLKELK